MSPKPFFMNKFIKKTLDNLSHFQKNLKVRYLGNYKTSVLPLLIKIAKRMPRALLEKDASVHSFTELPISKYCHHYLSLFT